jgi:choline dehydrogenase-like flavoprotein
MDGQYVLVESDVDTDVVVIGSGCTGGWACKVLTEAGYSVLLLEAGRELSSAERPDRWYHHGDREPAADTSRHPVQKHHGAYCEANRALWINDLEHPYLTDPENPFVWIRARTLGGRSNLWGGQCWRLTSNELQAPLIDGIGETWPLDYADLLPHYEEVEAFQGVCGNSDDDPHMPDQIVDGSANLTNAELRLLEQLRGSGQRAPIPVRSASARLDENGWPRFSSLGSTLPAALRTGKLRIVSGATVARLEVDAQGRKVRAAHYVETATGREQKARAHAFLLCASTIESTRILLNSASPQHPQGLGNSSGTLGRYLMDHVATVLIGRMDADANAEATFFGGRHGLYLPRVHDEAAFHRSYACWISLGRPMGHGLNAVINAIGEVLPYSSNRVVLEHSQCDRWGVPIPRIEYHEHDNERAMRTHQRHRLLELARQARIEVAAGPNDVGPGLVVHEVGTARMGRDPRTSFCNNVAQSWDVPNLFVPDGACWSTSAYQNPTLTMMALAARCSHFVARQLARLRR